MNSFAIVDKGRVRKTNQDTAEIVKKDGVIFAILCDGMGGPAGGDRASLMCLEFLKKEFKKNFSKDYDVDNWLKHIIISANDEILRYASSKPELLGMGTTLSCIIIKGEHAYLASIGDSRIYHYNKNKIIQISEDQTLVASLLKGGYITQKEAIDHPKKSLLLSAVGSSTSDQLDIQIRRITSFENFLICSDGLYNMLFKDEVLKILNEEESLLKRSKKLVKKANEKGGVDNIGLILMEQENDR